MKQATFAYTHTTIQSNPFAAVLLRGNVNERCFANTFRPEMEQTEEKKKHKTITWHGGERL